MDDMAERRQVDAAGSDVGRDADLGAAVAQRLQLLVAFVLAMLARQGNRGETALDEARVKAADIVPRRAEQHRGLGIVKPEQVDDRALYVGGRDGDGLRSEAHKS